MTAPALIAADPPPPDDGLPPGQPYVSPDDLASIGPLWDDAVQQHLMPVVGEVWNDSAGQVHAEMVDAADVEFPFPSVGSATAEAYLAQARNTFDEVGDDLWQTARDQMVAGFEAGESIPQIAERLRASAGLTARKAVLVARTQVLDASNAGSIATARASGMEMTKGWLDTPDLRTRPTHKAAGATYGDTGMIDLNAQFVVGGYSCDRPHDPALPPAERASCRCTLAYAIPEASAQQARQEAAPQPELPGTSGVADPTPVVAPPVEDRAALRRAARARQKAIAEVEPVADLAAEVDNVLHARAGAPFDDELATILGQRLAQAEAAGIRAADLRAVRDAVEARNLVQVRAEMERLATGRGLSPIGHAGQRVPYDPGRMQPVAEVGDFGDGDAVEVIRQGHMFTIDTDTVQLDRAVVRAVVEVPAVARPVTLADRVRSGVVSRDTLSGGQNAARTELVTFGDGSRAVFKATKTVEGRSAKLQQDAEELAALTLRAFGMRAPEVYRQSARQIYMEFLDGQVAAKLPHAPGSWRVAGDYYESDQGRIMGLVDALTDNYDRNSGNWIVGSDGVIGAVDHGFAFNWYGRYGHPDIAPFGSGNYFREFLSRPFPDLGKWADNDLSAQDVVTARAVMMGLRPEYARAGHQDWHDKAMQRLDRIGEHATGTRDRLGSIAQAQIQALTERLGALQDLIAAGETIDEEGASLEALISQVQSTLVLLRKGKAGRR